MKAICLSRACNGPSSGRKVVTPGTDGKCPNCNHEVVWLNNEKSPTHTVVKARNKEYFKTAI